MARCGWNEAAAGALALVVVAGSAPWSGARAATMREALVTTYLTNPNLEASRAALRATDELISQADAAYRPQVFVNGTLEGTRGEAGTGQGGGGGDTLGGGAGGGGFSFGSSGSSQTIRQSEKTVSLTVQQSLYAGGGRTAAIQRAQNLVRAGRADLIATEQDTLLTAVDAYTAAWRDQAVLELALNNEERLQRQLEATRDRFEVGEVARTDVAQAEARLSRARADVEAGKADVAASNAFYERVVGQPPGELEYPVVLDAIPRTLGVAQATAADNPEIVAATFSLRAADNDVRVAVADLLPSLDLNGDATASDQPSSQTPWQRSATLGVTLSVPLYQGGAEYSQVREARQTLRQRRFQLDAAQRVVQERVAAFWDNVLASQASVQAFDSEVDANNVALEGVQQEALVGSRTVLDVLDAQQELFTSQVNLVRAQRDAVIASYELKSAVGELTAHDLSLAVERYDVEAYGERNRRRLFGLDDVVETATGTAP